MPKLYILDTNVLLHDPGAMFCFEENDVVIPITVIEEVDRFKRDLSEKGRNARTVSRWLDDLRTKGHLQDGVPLGKGGQLRVAFHHAQTLDQLPPELHGDSADNRILAIALECQSQQGQAVVLVTKDTNLRIKADAVGLIAEDYETDKVDIEELYTGRGEVSVSEEALQELHHNGFLRLAGDWHDNQCLLLTCASQPQHKVYSRYLSQGGGVIACAPLPHQGISRLEPRNAEQRFAFDLLLDPKVQLVTLVGKAGTGKTLLALAAGLHQVADERRYQRLLVARPVFPLGRDLGFLPGDVQEKIAPWMKPIYDNLELMLSPRSGRGGSQPGWQSLIDMGLLEIEALTYIRGRSIPEQYVIIDEAQNLTPHEVKTILTRVGEGTKIVLTGDPYQIDNPYVDASSNGLTYVVERFKDQAIAGHITLLQGERSPLAELAANLL